MQKIALPLDDLIEKYPTATGSVMTLGSAVGYLLGKIIGVILFGDQFALNPLGIAVSAVGLVIVYRIILYFYIRYRRKHFGSE